MTKRQGQGGQAIVLVTLGLVTMAGIMGLAVDLGWSFFVKEQAQAAADTGAMAAVQEAFARGSAATSSPSFTCDSVSVYCSPTPTDCSGFGAASHSNLADACLYAARNGFTAGTNRQDVTVQADNGSNSLPVSPTGASLGIGNITYWVSVRAVQSVPQLFSSVLGNRTGLVASVATAAILNNPLQGTFDLLNHATDCSGNTATTCGLDLYVAGEQHVYTPGGIYMASTCNQANGGATCSNEGGDYAGYVVCDGSTTDNAVVAATIVVQYPGMVSPYQGGQALGSGSSAGSVTNCTGATGYTMGNGGWCIPTSGSSSSGSGSTTCSTTPPVALATASYFQDPTQGLPQPPLISTSAPTCGILNGVLSSSAGGSGSAGASGSTGGGTTTLGPFAYYAYSATEIVAGQTVAIPNGNPVVVTGTVSFSSSAATSCPGISTGTAAASSFTTTYFYGGLQIGTDSTSATATFGPGQYVMVGANTTTIAQSIGTCSPCAGSVWSVTNSTITGDSTTGTMFIFTAPAIYGASSYPGLSAEDAQFGTGKAAALPNSASTLQYGNVNLGTLPGDSASGSVAGPGSTNGDITLTGITSAAPSTLSSYTGVVFWQDRGNSSITYNADGTSSDTAKSPAPPTGAEALVFGTNIYLTGILYQPRGGWLSNPPNASSGGANSGCTTYTGCITGQGENTDDLFQSEPNCGELQGSLQIITGALLNSCGAIDLTTGGVAVTKFKIGLIQ